MRLLILSLLFASPAALAAKGPVLSRTIGSVDEAVFTSREAALAGMIERLAAGKDGGVPTPADSAAGRREQAALLLDEVVSREADTFGLAAAEPKELEDLSGRAIKQAARSEWSKLRFTPEEIRQAVSRKLAAKNLVRIRSESMKSVISDSEAQAYFEKNRVKFGQLPFASFKANIKTFLAQQQLDERLRSWFEILRRKYKVREALEDERGG